MKSFGVLVLIIVPSFLFSQKVHPKILKLPMTFTSGYGAFPPSLKPINFEDTAASSVWSNTYLKVQGIPGTWKNTKKGIIWLNAHQFAYQNYLTGKITAKLYKELQESWQWTPDKKKLSAKPIKCYVTAISGEDDKGHRWAKIDANNNLDFSDDSAYAPAEYRTGANMDSLSKGIVSVKYEMVYKGQIVQRKIPLLVLSYNNSYWYNFPQYAIASLIAAGTKQKIAISSGDPDFTNSGIILINDTILTKKANADLIVSRGEYIMIHKKVYKNRDVDISQAVLQLEEVTEDYDKLYSTQVNFKAMPFRGKEFQTNEVLSLEKYKGKYLFIDFWGTWCNPCVREMPNLKTAYDSLDRSKFEILGIVGDDDSASLKEFIVKEKIPWAQILSDQVNKIVETYRIEGYPTSFLVNPEGVIIAKNLRGEKLYGVIREIMAR